MTPRASSAACGCSNGPDDDVYAIIQKVAPLARTESSLAELLDPHHVAAVKAGGERKSAQIKEWAAANPVAALKIRDNLVGSIRVDTFIRTLVVGMALREVQVYSTAMQPERLEAYAAYKQQLQPEVFRILKKPPLPM